LRPSETIEPPALRSLDTVHLVTALDVGAREMVVYDRRLAEVARRYGLDAVSPGP
jgi:predicted nucleic acid-binding protein